MATSILRLGNPLFLGNLVSQRQTTRSLGHNAEQTHTSMFSKVHTTGTARAVTLTSDVETIGVCVAEVKLTHTKR